MSLRNSWFLLPCLITMITTILLFLIVLSVLVLAHEWGHYITAKKIGAGVEEFGLGFPPRLFSWKGKDGMVWSLNAIPLGGFVRIEGESGESTSAKSFGTKSIPARLLVLAAGVLMNLVLAAVLFSAGFLIGIPSITEGDLPKQAIVKNEAVRITEMLPDSPAKEAGFAPGDTVLAINGVTVESGEGARESLRGFSEADNVKFEILRKGERMELVAAPVYLPSIEAYGIGVAMVETGDIRYPFYLAPVKGVEMTGIYTVAVVQGFYGLIRDLLLGAPVAESLSGPVGIATMTGEVAELGFLYLLQFTALLSVNLAVLNILPIPALDGGRIFFVLLEAVRRKKASPQLEAVVHNLGFMVLMILVILVTYRDIAKLI